MRPISYFAALQFAVLAACTRGEETVPPEPSTVRVTPVSEDGEAVGEEQAVPLSPVQDTGIIYLQPVREATEDQ